MIPIVAVMLVSLVLRIKEQLYVRNGVTAYVSQVDMTVPVVLRGVLLVLLLKELQFAQAMVVVFVLLKG